MIRFSYKLWSLDLFTDKELLHLLRLDVWSWLKHQKQKSMCDPEPWRKWTRACWYCHAGVQVISLQITVENMCDCSTVFQGCFKTHWNWFFWCIYALCYIWMCSHRYSRWHICELYISPLTVVAYLSSSEELPKAAFLKLGFTDPQRSVANSKQCC